MNVSGDVHQTLEYRAATAIVRLLPTGLLLIFLGLLLLALFDVGRESAGTSLGILLCLLTGAGVIAVALWTRRDPGKPLFTLSPDGIRYRIPWVKSFLVPWNEVRGVDSIDIAARNSVNLNGVTVVLVSKQFYDSRIFVDSYFLRGPGWDATFIPKGAVVQMALHHELVSVNAQALREAVETRWLAFCDRPAATPQRTGAATASKPDIVAMGDSPSRMSGWDTAKIAALLIGIAAVLANLGGLWELPANEQQREVRARVREDQNYWEETSRRWKEETRQRDAEEKKRRQEFDQELKRAFGR